MSKPTSRQVNFSKDTNDFKNFLVILERNRKQGQNYVIMRSISKKLHYRLIEENFIIKRKEITIKKYIFLNKSVLHYIIKPEY